jgi:hypothetical protein
MRIVGISLAAVGLSSLLLAVVVASAVLVPISHLEKHHVEIGNWTTTVYGNRITHG